jgi:hypothetical protein
MAKAKDRVLTPPGPAWAPPAWYQDADTPDGPARLWHFLPSEAFAQVRHFETAGLDRQTLGDVPPADEAQRLELAKFLGRSLIRVDCDVHKHQGTPGYTHIFTVWPIDEVLRLARQAAIFHGLRDA